MVLHLHSLSDAIHLGDKLLALPPQDTQPILQRFKLIQFGEFCRVERLTLVRFHIVHSARQVPGGFHSDP